MGQSTVVDKLVGVIDKGLWTWLWKKDLRVVALEPGGSESVSDGAEALVDKQGRRHRFQVGFQQQHDLVAVAGTEYDLGLVGVVGVRQHWPNVAGFVLDELQCPFGNFAEGWMRLGLELDSHKVPVGTGHHPHRHGKPAPGIDLDFDFDRGIVAVAGVLDLEAVALPPLFANVPESAGCAGRYPAGMRGLGRKRQRPKGSGRQSLVP